jgi:uncharacterized protein
MQGRHFMPAAYSSEESIFHRISQSMGLSITQVRNTVSLLDQDHTIPFIARYRKEMTGSLDEDRLLALQQELQHLRSLEKRKETVLNTIREQGKLTPSLEKRIVKTEKFQDLEDLYLPYKPKKRTRASVARERGLEKLAEMILRQDTLSGSPTEAALAYINPDKGVSTPEEALAGACDIVAETIAEDPAIRRNVRKLTWDLGSFCARAKDPEKPGDFELYADFSQPILTILPHRVLAVNRGEKEGFLRASIQVPENEILQAMESHVVTNEKSIFYSHLKGAITDSYRRLLGPSLEREIRQALREKADLHAIGVFARNLRALLMTPPLRKKRIMGIDPGYRTGCKVAVIDETGKYLHGETIYPHPPQKKWREGRDRLLDLSHRLRVDVVAVGNGTASRETEQLVVETLQMSDHPMTYAIVSEAGASVYSASPVAQREFPDLEASLRGNISIARRLLDPLSELVKIDPKSLGVGLYQHDVDQNLLSRTLDQVVSTCVNSVGVDLNTASASLLQHVSGINRKVAENIVKYRETHGRFSSREMLKSVSGLGDHAFVQASGFLRIPEGENFFDNTAVHPESYHIADQLLEILDLKKREVRRHGEMIRQKITGRSEAMESLAESLQCGLETLQDIIESLEKPQRDPRDSMPGPILRSDILSMDDLREGMLLKGTVRNVVDFGAFVDIGVKHDGLIHLSRMSKKYIKNPLDVLSVGDIVEVRVIKIDRERGRIGLSLLLDEPLPGSESGK